MDARHADGTRIPKFRERLTVHLYDALIEPLVRGFRMTGLQMAPPRPGQRVLDVGCGTGRHLSLYADGGSHAVGVELSAAMASRATRRLGERGRVVEADAAALPFADAGFDLVIAATVLHALDPDVRVAALREMSRVTAPGGKLLIIDGHAGPITGPRSRTIRAFTTLIERIAGGDHYRNYRRFLESGGLPELAGRLDLTIVEQRVEAAGTMGVYTVR